jgi:hypothetical protein
VEDYERVTSRLRVGKACVVKDPRPSPQFEYLVDLLVDDRVDPCGSEKDVEIKARGEHMTEDIQNARLVDRFARRHFLPVNALHYTRGTASVSRALHDLVHHVMSNVSS